MEWYHWTVIAAAAIAILLAWHVPRAPLWIALGAILYGISAAWHNAELPHALLFGAATNFAMILLLWLIADQKWEMRLWNFYHLMLLIDALYAFGVIREKLIFASSLEAVNLLALLFIGATGAADRIYVDNWRADNGFSGYLHRTLFAERAYRWRPPWQK